MFYTPAEANKLVKKIEVAIGRLLIKEDKSATFNAASGEDVESLRPQYSFEETQAEMESLYEKLRKVKHAINVFNTTHELPGFDGVTIDQALVYIPQLKTRASKLKVMADRLPKERCDAYTLRSNIIDYEYANYDIDAATEAYNEYLDKLAAMQLALDTVNSTEKIEIDVELN